MHRFGITKGFASKSGQVMPNSAVQALNRTGFGFADNMHFGRDHLGPGRIMVAANMFNIKEFQLLPKPPTCLSVPSA